MSTDNRNRNIVLEFLLGASVLLVFPLTTGGTFLFFDRLVLPDGFGDFTIAAMTVLVVVGFIASLFWCDFVGDLQRRLREAADAEATAPKPATAPRPQPGHWSITEETFKVPQWKDALAEVDVANAEPEKDTRACPEFRINLWDYWQHVEAHTAIPWSKADMANALGISEEQLGKSLRKEEIPTHGSRMVRKLRAMKTAHGMA